MANRIVRSGRFSYKGVEYTYRLTPLVGLTDEGLQVYEMFVDNASTKDPALYYNGNALRTNREYERVAKEMIDECTPRTFKEVCNGYGLNEVPSDIAKDFICQICQAKHPGKLYTDKPLPTSSNLREYSRQVDNIRLNCYCKDHILAYFGE